jgi:hypothetical protein
MDKNQCNSQFHCEVLKKLHSMKSNKSLEALKVVDRPTSDEIESLNLVCSKQLNVFDGELESEDFKIESANDIELNEVNTMNIMQKISKVLQRNKELEDALKIKKLRSRNEELEKELKRKETLRLSQLELLALRNVELEKELHQHSSG